MMPLAQQALSPPHFPRGLRMGSHTLRASWVLLEPCSDRVLQAPAL